MAHPDDLAFHLEQGGQIMDRSLGIQAMPAGYHLLLDADGMFFSWFEIETGRESVPHWNKWAVYRGAKIDAAKHAE